MAELQKLYEALERADAAGDTESAKELATWIKSSPGFSQPKEPEPETFAPTQPYQTTPVSNAQKTMNPIMGNHQGMEVALSFETQKAEQKHKEILGVTDVSFFARFGIKGAKEYADRQMAEAAQAQQDIERNYPSAVPSYTNIKGAGDLLTYIVEAVGETLPSILPSIFTGGVAGIAGRGAVVAAEQAAKAAAMEAAKKRLTSSAGKMSSDTNV